MFNRISFGGSFTKLLYEVNIFDINKREFLLLFTLIVFTVILGIFPTLILNVIHYPVIGLIYNF
jgi:NADH-ubiquinone oxidoreductase chain 4